MKRTFIMVISTLLFLSLLLFPKADITAMMSEEDMESLFSNPEVAISIDLQDANLKDILKIFSVQSGLNFIASESVQNRLVTLYLDKVPVREAMEKLFKVSNLAYEIEPDSNVVIVKDLGKPKIDTETRVFYLKYATVSTSSLKEEMKYKMSPESASGTTTTSTSTSSGASSASGKWKTEEDAGITKAVKKMLSEYGSVIEDFRTNSLTVTDVPSRMPAIAQTIAALDISVPQVMLEVEMLDVSKNTVDKIGFKFGQTPITMTLTGAAKQTSWPINYLKRVAGTVTPGSLSFATAYTALIDFLRTQTDTKYLARPRLLTLNNETAEIKITTQETVGVNSTVTVATATSTTTEPERAETGVHLRVTPQINTDTGEVTMFIVPIIKDTAASTILIGNSGSNYYKDPEERSTKSTVRVKDGETVIIGGLLRRQNTTTTTKLPILGDIPLLGLLFRHKSVDPGRERELLVFITPHIIKEGASSALAATAASQPATASAEEERSALIKASLTSLERKKD